MLNVTEPGSVVGKTGGDDFDATPERGCFLKPEGLKRYFGESSRALVDVEPYESYHAAEEGAGAAVG